LRAHTHEQNVEIWAYCLMDNHVHLILVPAEEKGLSIALGETHKRYTRMVNCREGWRGHLWEGRYKSFVMNEQHLAAAVRYVENNPVRAGIVQNAQNYMWSSARGHIRGGSDQILDRFFLEETIGDWKSYLGREENAEIRKIRGSVITGTPLGDDRFVEQIEKRLGRSLRRKKPGPKPRLI
jgi:putative transposase